MRTHSRRYPGIARSKLTSVAPSCSMALKCSLRSVCIGTITHIITVVRTTPPCRLAEGVSTLELALTWAGPRSTHLLEHQPPTEKYAI
jgi:hypothetical protein